MSHFSDRCRFQESELKPMKILEELRTGTVELEPESIKCLGGSEVRNRNQNFETGDRTDNVFWVTIKILSLN